MKCLPLLEIKQIDLHSVDRLRCLLFTEFFLYVFKSRKQISVTAVDRIGYRCFLLSYSYRINSLVERLKRTCACDASARTCHAFEQIAVIFSGSSLFHHLHALIKSLSTYHFDFTVRIDPFDMIDNSLRDTAADGKPETIAAGFPQRLFLLTLSKNDIPGIEHACKFFKCQNKIDVALDCVSVKLPT